MLRYIILMIAVIGILFGATRVYEIEPYKNCNSWSPQGPPTTAYIGQTFIATCDSFVWADFFVGAPNDTGYNVEIYEYPASGLPIFGGYAEGKKSYEYTKANLQRVGSQRIIKGKQYLLKITNVRGDSINFYYNPHNPYKYGQIMLPQGGAGPVHPWDLAARIEGMGLNV